MVSWQISSIAIMPFLVLLLTPAFADVLEFKSDKESYAVNDVIMFSGKSNPLDMLQIAFFDSEEEMLGYGIGIILLNLGMYFVIPALIIQRIRKTIH